VEPRRAGPRRGADALPAPTAPASRALTDVRNRQRPPAADRRQRRDREVLAQQRGARLGPVHHRPDRRRAARDPAADLQAGPLDAGAAEAPARDEEAPGALQGGQEAPAGRDDEALPGAPDQPAGLLPPAHPAAAVLLRPLPDVEEGRRDQ